MYPFIRLAKVMWTARSMPKLGVWDTHISHHIIWPLDIDIFMELNNGRTLTLFDLGRFGASTRLGLMDVLKSKKWSFAVAGVSVRFRRRVRPFERVEMRTRIVGWDDKFTYIEQTLWKKSGECANHILLRTAVTGPSGIVPPDEVQDALGTQESRPTLPDWVQAWIDADNMRPWPPMSEQ